MGSSIRLGVSSQYLSAQELDFLADHTCEEDSIYLEISRLKGFESNPLLMPTAIRDQILLNEENVLANLFPGLSLECAAHNLASRLDRCLVASLASLISPESAILETGTYGGFTTAIIAFVLDRNGFNNNLFTIDLPTSEMVTQVHHIDVSSIGSCIPDRLRKYVIQIFNDAKVALPSILADNCVELFIHDSLHTITHMMFEYVVSRTLMPPYSILASDDILWNSSFVEFVRMFECPFWVCKSNPNYGFAVNVPHPQERQYSWGPQPIGSYMKAMRSRSVASTFKGLKV